MKVKADPSSLDKNVPSLIRDQTNLSIPTTILGGKQNHNLMHKHVIGSVVRNLATSLFTCLFHCS